MNFPQSVAIRVGLLAVFCFAVSCDTRQASDAATRADDAVALVADNQADSPTDAKTASQLEPSIAIAKGDFSWKRLLGPSFDGVAQSGDIKFDWQRKPELLWEIRVGEGYGLGSIKSGTYYHSDSVRKEGQRVERLTAYELDTAKVVWSVDRPLDYQDLYGYESGPRGTPTIAGESIVTLGVDGDLYCRDVSDGSVRWHVSTNDDYGVVQNFFGVGASPLVLEGNVLVPVGGSPPEDQDVAPGRLDRVVPNGTALVAFDLETGSETWRCGDDLASYSSPRTMQLGSQTVVLLFARDHLMMIDPASGSVLWKQRHRADILESVNAMIPVVDGNQVFVSECYRIGSRMMKVSLAGQETIWQDPPRSRERAMRCHWSTPILINGYLYGCSGRNNPDSDFRCIDFNTGDVQWVDDRSIRSSVARVDDHLIVLDEDGSVQIVKPDPEKLIVVAEHDFRDTLTGPCWAAPIVVGNRLLIRGNHRVICVALPTKE